MSEPLTTLVATSEPVLSSDESAADVSVGDPVVVGVPELVGEPSVFAELEQPIATAANSPAQVSQDIDACKRIRMRVSCTEVPRVLESPCISTAALMGEDRGSWRRTTV